MSKVLDMLRDSLFALNQSLKISISCTSEYSKRFWFFCLLNKVVSSANNMRSPIIGNKCISLQNTKPSEGENATVHANMVDVAYCSRVGRAHLNYNRPISIMFHSKEDKELLMANKKHLPTGIYANDEFLIHVKRIRDCLRIIFRMVKGMQEYKDSCKLEGDKLVINGVKYGVVV